MYQWFQTAPQVEKLQLHGCPQLDEKILYAYFLCERQQWTLRNIQPFRVGDNLNLQGLSITDSSLRQLAVQALPVQKLDLRSCTKISLAGLLVLARHPSLKKVLGINYAATSRSMTREEINNDLDLNELLEGAILGHSRHNTISIWDAATYQLLTVLKERTWVSAISIMPSGRIITGSYDYTLRIWYPNSNPSVFVLRGKHRGVVLALAILSDNRFASGSQDNTICIWNTNSHGCLDTLKGHTSAVLTLAVIPEGAAMRPQGLIISGSADNTIRVWDADTYQCLNVLIGHTKPVTALGILPEGQIISSTYDKMIRVWSFPNLTLNYSPLQALKGKVTLILNEKGVSLQVNPSELTTLEQALETLATLLQPYRVVLDSASYSIHIPCRDEPPAFLGWGKAYGYHLLRRLQVLQPVAIDCQTMSYGFNETEIDDWLKDAWPLVRVMFPSHVKLKAVSLQKLISQSASLQQLTGFCLVSISVASVSGDNCIRVRSALRNDLVYQCSMEKDTIEILEQRCLDLDQIMQLKPELIQQDNQLTLDFNETNNECTHTTLEIQKIINTYQTLIELCFKLLPEHASNGRSLTYGCPTAQAQSIEHFLHKCWTTRQATISRPRLNNLSSRLAFRTQLDSNPKIGTLNLIDIPLGYKEVRFHCLLQLIRHDEALTFINLSKTQLTDKNAQLLLGALQQNPTLIGLDLSGNNLSSKILAQFEAHFTKKNAQRLQNLKISFSECEFNTKEPLGKGHYGEVYCIRLNDQLVAIKELRSMNHNHGFYQQPSESEALLLANYKHPHIVQLYGVNFSDKMHILMEYVPGGSLQKLIDQQVSPFSLAQQYQFALDIAYGLAFIHSHQISHQNLKSDNILISSDGRLKITDLGTSLLQEFCNASITHRAIYRYRAPELWTVNMSHYPPQADCYSYGIMLWEIATCQKAYSELSLDEEGLYQHIVAEEKRPQPHHPKETSEGVAALISRCWLQRREERPTAAQIVEDLETLMEHVQL